MGVQLQQLCLMYQSSVGSPSISAGEPEQELVPPSRDVSDPLDPLRPTSSCSTTAPVSSSPARAVLYMHFESLRTHWMAWMTISENPEVGKGLHGFLARRLNKKGAAARAKELNFTKATGDEREGIQEARKREWGNWRGFDAVEVFPPEKVKEALAEHQPWPPPKYKSRIVVRGKWCFYANGLSNLFGDHAWFTAFLYGQPTATTTRRGQRRLLPAGRKAGSSATSQTSTWRSSRSSGGVYVEGFEACSRNTRCTSRLLPASPQRRCRTSSTTRTRSLCSTRRRRCSWDDVARLDDLLWGH